MSKTLYLIFNHEFTPAQKADAEASLGVAGIEKMPETLREIWGNIPPDLPGIRDHLAPVRKWLDDHARPLDYVLIQGDFGACYLMVGYAFEKGWRPIYSTTGREALETLGEDGSITLVHRFFHRIFREYDQ